MRHGWALLAALLGSFVISIPSWISPLLSPVHAQRLTEFVTVSSHTYRYLAIAFFGLGLMYASFLAWDEERDEIDRLTADMANRKSVRHEQAQALWQNNREIRASRMEARERDLNQQLKRTFNSKRVSQLAAFHKQGKELFDWNLIEERNFESWKLSVDAWRRDVLANLTEAEKVRFDQPISHTDEARGYPAISNPHGDMRGRLLVWLERLTNIIESLERS
jgi:hypothetical protein